MCPLNLALKGVNHMFTHFLTSYLFTPVLCKSVFFTKCCIKYVSLNLALIGVNHMFTHFLTSYLFTPVLCKSVLLNVV